MFERIFRRSLTTRNNTARYYAQQSETRLAAALSQLAHNETVRAADVALRNVLLSRNEVLERRRASSVAGPADHGNSIDDDSRISQAEKFAFRGLIVQLERQCADLNTKLARMNEIASSS